MLQGKEQPTILLLSRSSVQSLDDDEVPCVGNIILFGLPILLVCLKGLDEERIMHLVHPTNSPINALYYRLSLVTIILSCALFFALFSLLSY